VSDVMETPYDAGFRTAREGLSRGRNPYRKDIDRHWLWMEGYDAWIRYCDSLRPISTSTKT